MFWYLLLGLQSLEAPAVQVERLDESSYLLSLPAEPAQGAAHAQAKAEPFAKPPCARSRPVLGRFRFVLDDGRSRFEQEMFCFSAGHWSSGVSLANSKPEPSRADQQKILAASYGYFSAKDASRYGQAHAYLSSRMKRRFPLASWSQSAAEFNAEAGAVRGRRVVEITWYKDPQDAPEPGLYVAADYSAEFAGAEFVCGYLMWQVSANGGLSLVREEQNMVPRRPTGRPLAQIDREPLRARMGCKD
jgi:hypothetical protein